MRRFTFLLLAITALVFSQPVNADSLQENVLSGQITFVKWAGKNGELQREICLVNLEAEDEKCITNTSSKDETSPQWSSDGKILAYQVTDLPLGDGKTETHLYDLEQNKVIVLPTAWYIYSWSPDGKRFVTTDFIDQRGFGEIAIVRLDDYQVERLTDDTAADLQPAWSPDGNHISYLSGFPDSDLMVISADGSDQKQLTNAIKINNEVKPVWSPDGQQIAFVVNGEFIGQDQTSEIYVINADGTNLHQLTNTGGVNLIPQWSPDGKQLVFYGYAVGAFDDIGSTTSLRTEVFRMNADGSDLTNLTNSIGLDYQPSWSPDGNWIVYASTQEGPGIYIMRSDGTDVHMITHEPSYNEGGHDVNYPVWRPESVKSD